MKKCVLHHQLITFFGLSFFITWLLLVPLILSERGLFNISPHWHASGSLGPLLAAIITTKMAGGSNGLKSYFNQFRKYQVGKTRFFIAVFSPLLLF